jgi:hypothetical protein
MRLGGDMQKICLVLISLCFGLGTFAAAQYTPVIATQRTTSQVISVDGRTLADTTTVNKFYRNSYGSTLTQHLVERDGKMIPESADLNDFVNTQKAYKLVYGSKDAIVRRCLDGPRLEPRLDIPVTKGTDTIQGVQVVAIEMKAKINGQIQTTGKAWIAPDLGAIVLKEDSTEILPDGSRHHIVTETLELKTNEEPAAELFLVNSFNVMTKSAAVSCKKPL